MISKLTVQAQEQSSAFQPRIPEVSMLLPILLFFSFLFQLLNAIFCRKKMLIRKAMYLKANLIKCNKNSIHHSMGEFFWTFELQILQSTAPQNLSKQCVLLLWRGSYSWCSVFGIFLKEESQFHVTEIFEVHSNEKYFFYYFTIFIHCTLFFFFMAKTIPRKWS